MSDFMEGVDPLDYCIDCGAKLEELVTNPDGSREIVKHENGSEECIKNSRENEAFQASSFSAETFGDRWF